jgi:D-3-phosphoglycerate dehydrogenase
MKGKTLGIIGLGNIGLKVAARAKGFGLEILGYDPYVSSEVTKPLGITSVDLDTLLTKADFVTIHVRLGPQTTGMIGRREISLMKKTAFLINTSRGDIIDENALAEALKEKKIAGAALDVFVNEPIYLDTNNPFLHLDNVTSTPHLAGPSDEMMYRGACIVADDLARYLKGEPLRNVMNAAAL